MTRYSELTEPSKHKAVFSIGFSLTKRLTWLGKSQFK
jgi:hypothetical protein